MMRRQERSKGTSKSIFTTGSSPKEDAHLRLPSPESLVRPQCNFEMDDCWKRSSEAPGCQCLGCRYPISRIQSNGQEIKSGVRPSTSEGFPPPRSRASAANPGSVVHPVGTPSGAVRRAPYRAEVEPDFDLDETIEKCCLRVSLAGDRMPVIQRHPL